MEADPELQAILEKWGSEDVAYEFLRKEFERINSDGFGGCLSVPHFQIKPIWLSRGLMGERNSLADYEPAEGNRPARIGIFTAALLDDDRLRRVLAHEMIHHWEHAIADDQNTGYPSQLDEMISDGFSDSVREDRWRRWHSPRFLSKAYSLAKLLDIVPRKLLFGG